MAKLKDLLREAFEDTPNVDRRQTIEGVRNFGIVGKSLYNNGNIMREGRLKDGMPVRRWITYKEDGEVQNIMDH